MPHARCGEHIRVIVHLRDLLTCITHNGPPSQGLRLPCHFWREAPPAGLRLTLGRSCGLLFPRSAFAIFVPGGPYGGRFLLGRESCLEEGILRSAR